MTDLSGTITITHDTVALGVGYPRTADFAAVEYTRPDGYASRTGMLSFAYPDPNPCVRYILQARDGNPVVGEDGRVVALSVAPDVAQDPFRLAMAFATDQRFKTYSIFLGSDHLVREAEVSGGDPTLEDWEQELHEATLFERRQMKKDTFDDLARDFGMMSDEAGELYEPSTFEGRRYFSKHEVDVILEALGLLKKKEEF